MGGRQWKEEVLPAGMSSYQRTRAAGSTFLETIPEN
jgi:hypothetical protein